jgi:hypothetical protein
MVPRIPSSREEKTEERSNSARCWTETWSPAGDPGKQGFPWLLNGFNGVHMWIHGFFWLFMVLFMAVSWILVNLIFM